jgi:hypothetical protein
LQRHAGRRGQSARLLPEALAALAKGNEPAKKMLEAILALQKLEESPNVSQEVT